MRAFPREPVGGQAIRKEAMHAAWIVGAMPFKGSCVQGTFLDVKRPCALLAEGTSGVDHRSPTLCAHARAVATHFQVMTRNCGACFFKTLHELRVECVGARQDAEEARPGSQDEFLRRPAPLAILVCLVSVKPVYAACGASAPLGLGAVDVLLILGVFCSLRQGGAWHTHGVCRSRAVLPKLPECTRLLVGAMCACNKVAFDKGRVEFCFTEQGVFSTL